MSSEVDICNLALTWLGANPIISLDDPQTEAKVAKATYPYVRDEVLSESAWTFAIRRNSLPKLADAPHHYFANAYQLPSDCLRVLTLNVYQRGQVQPEYAVEGGMLLTDEGKADIVYLARVVDPAEYPPQFVMALAYKLASAMAVPIAHDANLMAAFEQQYQVAKRKAVATDNIQGTSRQIRSPWLLARRGSGSYGSVAGPTV